MTTEMVLGTAQLGSAYGINNKIGELDALQAFDILSTAFDEGIRLLDTAEGYGRSEDLIGSYLQMNHDRGFDICTKLTGGLNGKEDAISDSVRHRIEASLARLACREFAVYYLHSFDACLDEDVMNALNRAQANGLIRRIGVSLYEPEELRYILDHPEMGVGAVQIPFNLLNASQWVNGDLLSETSRRDIAIFTRSAYVQGLIFKSPCDSFVRELGLEGAIRRIQELAKKLDVSIARLACDFVRSFKDVSYVILGCETSLQVRENAALFRAPSVWTENQISDQLALSEAIPRGSVDPRTWF